MVIIFFIILLICNQIKGNPGNCRKSMPVIPGILQGKIPAGLDTNMA